MGRRKDIDKIMSDVIEPMMESIMSGEYQLEDATKDIGTQRVVFKVSLQLRSMLRLDNYTIDPQWN